MEMMNKYIHDQIGNTNRSKSIVDSNGTFWKPFLFYIIDYKTLINNAHLLLIEKKLPSKTMPSFLIFPNYRIRF